MKSKYALVLASMFLVLPSIVTIAESQGQWTVALPILEREPRAEELVAYPVDQSKAGVNPPGFCWTPHDGAQSYRLEVSGVRRRQSGDPDEKHRACGDHHGPMGSRCAITCRSTSVCAPAVVE